MKTQVLQYYNAPVELYRRFLDNHTKCLNDVFDYVAAGYEHCEYVSKIMGANILDWESTKRNGAALRECKYNGTLFSIPRNTFWNYYGKEHKRTELLDLLAYLALKSICGRKTICQCTTQRMFIRMAGFGGKEDFNMAYNNNPTESIKKRKERLLRCYGDIMEYFENERKMRDTGKRIRDRLTKKHKFYHYSKQCRYFVFMFSDKNSRSCKIQLADYVERHRTRNQKQEMKEIAAEVRAKYNREEPPMVEYTSL